jgi:hypothetical protein
MSPRRLLLGFALLLAPAVAPAQLLSYGVGGGTGVGRRNGPAAAESHAHALGYLQIGVPLFPLAIRGDAMLLREGTGGGPVAVSSSAVLRLPLPVVSPYVTVGYGQYGTGDRRVNGWSAGAGVRVKLPVLPGVFGEVRRHQRLGRDLVTVGLSF